MIDRPWRQHTAHRPVGSASRPPAFGQPSLPELTFRSDGAVRFANLCQAAVYEYVPPTDSVRVARTAWRILNACPQPAALESRPEFALVLLQVAQRTLGISGWGPSVITDDGCRSSYGRAAEALDRLLLLYSSPSVTLNTLAPQVGVSPAHLCTVLERGSGYGFSAHLSGFRLLAAMRSFGETDEPLRVIAKRCGYADVVVLAHEFRRTVGITATQFRRLLQWASEKTTQS